MHIIIIVSSSANQPATSRSSYLPEVRATTYVVVSYDQTTKIFFCDMMAVNDFNLALLNLCIYVVVVSYVEEPIATFLPVIIHNTKMHSIY